MAFIGSETVRAVTHIETLFGTGTLPDHHLPEVRDPYRHWIEDAVTHMDRFNPANPQSQLTFWVDAFRRMPFIDAFPNHPSNGNDPLDKYKNEQGEWTHQDANIETLISLWKRNPTDGEIIGRLFSTSNIAKITTAIQAAKEIGRPISEPFIIEALLLAEILAARSGFEIEFQSGKPAVRRINDGESKKEREALAEDDPFVHVFQAYELAKYAEKQMEVGFAGA